MRAFRSLVAALSLGAAVPAAAQQQADSSVVDYIVAVVGNRPILRSQVDEQINTLRAQQGEPSPEQRAALFRELLRTMINTELVVQAAQRDTAIKVTDEEVTQSVDELFRNARRRFQTEEAFRAELQNSGFMTIEEWRSYTAEMQRRRFLEDRFWERLEAAREVKSVPPTDAEIRAQFERVRPTMGKRSEAISFLQIVIPPRPSEAEKTKARALADSILGELRSGADFATAARRFSMDPQSREQGGSLGWIRRGQGWDPRFEQAAFNLRVGQVSNPVETSFGFHLIQVERVQPAELSVRHILIMPEIDSVMADSARQLASEVHRAAMAGASFDSLQRLHHERIEEREASQFPVDRLPPAYAAAVREVKEGEIAPMFELEAPGNRSKFVVLKVTSRIPAGDFRFEDVRDQIRAQLSRELGRERYREKLRQATFVEIREP
jgi:peptidyl-prolyl cis-trans isomerase SurA